VIIMSVVEYRIKNVGKTAADFRAKAAEVTGVDCYVEVHPGLVRFRFVSEIKADKLKALDKYMREAAEGERVG